MDECWVSGAFVRCSCQGLSLHINDTISLFVPSSQTGFTDRYRHMNTERIWGLTVNRGCFVLYRSQWDPQSLKESGHVETAHYESEMGLLLFLAQFVTVR